MMMDKRWIKRDTPRTKSNSDQTETPDAEAPTAKSTSVFGRATSDRQLGVQSDWDRLSSFQIDEAHLEKNRIITATRRDPSHSAFDVLRTKILQAIRENGWSRVAVTSPTEGCGKTFMSVNLTLSLSRQSNCRSALIDFDMRRPSVAKIMGIKNPASVGDFLRGDTDAAEVFRRPGQNLLKIGDGIAVAANGRREEFASELLQQPMTADVLDEFEEDYAPDLILFDLPPALVNDDVLAARQLFDAVLLIVGGGITKPDEVRKVEQRLGTETPLLGVVMNKSEGVSSQYYSY